MCFLTSRSARSLRVFSLSHSQRLAPCTFFPSLGEGAIFVLSPSRVGGIRLFFFFPEGVQFFLFFSSLPRRRTLRSFSLYRGGTIRRLLLLFSYSTSFPLFPSFSPLFLVSSFGTPIRKKNGLKRGTNPILPS